MDKVTVKDEIIQLVHYDLGMREDFPELSGDTVEKVMGKIDALNEETIRCLVSEMKGAKYDPKDVVELMSKLQEKGMQKEVETVAVMLRVEGYDVYSLIAASTKASVIKILESVFVDTIEFNIEHYKRIVDGYLDKEGYEIYYEKMLHLDKQSLIDRLKSNRLGHQEMSVIARVISKNKEQYSDAQFFEMLKIKNTNESVIECGVLELCRRIGVREFLRHAIKQKMHDRILEILELAPELRHGIRERPYKLKKLTKDPTPLFENLALHDNDNDEGGSIMLIAQMLQYAPEVDIRKVLVGINEKMRISVVFGSKWLQFVFKIAVERGRVEDLFKYNWHEIHHSDALIDAMICIVSSDAVPKKSAYQALEYCAEHGKSEELIQACIERFGRTSMLDYMHTAPIRQRYFIAKFFIESKDIDMQVTDKLLTDVRGAVCSEGQDRVYAEKIIEIAAPYIAKKVDMKVVAKHMWCMKLKTLREIIKTKEELAQYVNEVPEDLILEILKNLED